MTPEDYDAAVEIVKKQRDSNLLAAEEAKLVCREILAIQRTHRGIMTGDKWDNLVEMSRKVIG